MAPRKGSKARRAEPRPRFDGENPETRKDDVYEAEDDEPEELKHAHRFDHVESYEYELPENFEDEEIEEDEAFNSEDERLYGHLFDDSSDAEEKGKGKGKGKGKSAPGSASDSDAVDLTDSGSEPDSELEEEDDDGFGELLARARAAHRAAGSDDEVLGEEGAGPGSGDEGGADASGSDGEAGAGVGTGDGAPAAGGRASRRPTERRVRSEAYTESEHTLASGQALSLSDMLAGLGDAEAARLGAPKRALERLERRGKAVDAPLPGPIRARAERQAGYEVASEEAARWAPVVAATRRAPTVRFTSARDEVSRPSTTAAIVAHHAPERAVELEVAALLRAAGAADAAALAASEKELSARALGPEAARQRADELAKTRALLHYHEVKAKRLKRIKSKEYRRQLRRAARRGSAAAGKALEDADPDDIEALQAALEEAERERAKERLTLRHRAQGKWAKRALRRGLGVADEGTRAALADQLEMGREVRRRAESMRARVGDDGSDGGSSSDSDLGLGGADGGFDSDGEPGARVRRAAREVLDDDADAALASSQSALLALPFMRRASEKRRAAARAEAKAALEELEDGEGAGSAGGAPGGRMRFTGGEGAAARATAERVAALEAGSDDSDDGGEREGAEAKAERLRRVLEEDRRRAGGTGAGTSEAAEGSTQANGDAAGPPADFQPSRAFAGARPGFAFKKGPKGVGYYRDERAGGGAEGGKARAVARVAGRAAGGSSAVGAPSEAVGRGGSGGSPRAARAPASPAAAPRVAIASASQPLSQEELVRRAFAGDDAVAEFAMEKAKEVEEQAPSAEVAGALPGWGSWQGAAKREPEWVQRARDKAQERRDKALRSRKDSRLEYVVLSEKWDKHAQKYRATSVPFPYESKEAYESSLRQPLGPDFNTDASFRDLTRPAILKDAGVVIAPAKYSDAIAHNARAGGKDGTPAAVTTIAGGRRKRSRGDKA